MKKKVVLKLQMSNVDGVYNRTITYPRKKKENDYEFLYALDEHEKRIMRMEINDRFYFKSLRDEKNSLGIATRIK